jgi:pimeloyl-ACP methyl ester carboxylesterase
MSPIDPERPAGVAEHPDPRALFMAQQQRLLAQYRVDAVSRYVQLARPALRMHLLEAGSGEPLVILHGGDGQGIDWAPLMALLQRDSRVYAVDRPGFGLSDPFDYRRVDLRRHAADVVDSLLDALGLDSATLIGGSMGGFFALAAALARPQRIRRLILVGMPAGLSTDCPLALRLACAVPGATHLMMRRLARPTTEPRKQQYREMFRADLARIPEVYFEMQQAGLAIPGAPETWAVLLRRVAGLRGMRPEVTLTADLPRIAQPTLVLWGERDMTPVEGGRVATARMPGARFVVIEGVGHFPFLEAPERCASLIREFAGLRREPLAA